MTLTNAPAIVTQLAVQMGLCAGWTGGSGATWYPEVPASGATYPLAVLAESGRTFSTYAAGAGGLQGGTLSVVIYSSGDIGTLESLGRTVISQLLAQVAGIPFDAGDCSTCSDSTPAMVAGSSDIRNIELILPYGLKA